MRGHSARAVARCFPPCLPPCFSLMLLLLLLVHSHAPYPPRRNQCAPEDLYYPHPLIQDVLWWALYQCEGLLLGSGLRKRALAECMKHIHYEVGVRCSCGAWVWEGAWVGCEWVRGWLRV